MTPLFKTLRFKLIMASAMLIALVAVVTYLYFQLKETKVELTDNTSIDITPQQIQSIKAIGEWEFLSITNEEMIDTVRRGIFSDDHLVRIYHGTMRLGINLQQAHPGWIQTKGDSIVMTLPPITLLDNDFIDETRTLSFFESGTWSGRDREAMYKRAYQRMLSTGLSEANIQTAQTNAQVHFHKMLTAMGFNHIAILFEKPE